MEYQGYNDPRADQGDPDEIQGDNSQGSTEGLTEGQQTGVQQQFDPNTWELNYKGNKVYPKDRDHLINLAQQGWSYSQNMEELNKRQKEIDELQNKYTTYDQLDGVIRQYPEFAQKINALFNDFQNGLQNTTSENGENGEDDRFNQISREMNELKQFKQEILSRRADEELEKSIESLTAKYPDHNWDKDTGDGTFKQQLLKHALKNDIVDLERAYKDMMFDYVATNSKAEALKKQAEQTKKNNMEGIIEGGYSGDTSSNEKLQYSQNDSYGDLTVKAINYLQGG